MQQKNTPQMVQFLKNKNLFSSIQEISIFLLQKYPLLRNNMCANVPFTKLLLKKVDISKIMKDRHFKYLPLRLKLAVTSKNIQLQLVFIFCMWMRHA